MSILQHRIDLLRRTYAGRPSAERAAVAELLRTVALVLLEVNENSTAAIAAMEAARQLAPLWN